jgi:hypothetical protein
MGASELLFIIRDKGFSLKLRQFTCYRNLLIMSLIVFHFAGCGQDYTAQKNNAAPSSSAQITAAVLSYSCGSLDGCKIYCDQLHLECLGKAKDNEEQTCTSGKNLCYKSTVADVYKTLGLSLPSDTAPPSDNRSTPAPSDPDSSSVDGVDRAP